MRVRYLAALLTVAIPTLQPSGIAQSPMGARSPSGLEARSEVGALLGAHNFYRAKHCSPPLVWSPQIAALAQQWADRCVLNHDPANTLGENLAWGTSLSPSDAVGLWYEEAGLYNYAAPGFGPAGHFSQLVWRGSKLLGCGHRACGDEILWVCRYAPAGNYDGEYRENVPPPCR